MPFLEAARNIERTHLHVRRDCRSRTRRKEKKNDAIQRSRVSRGRLSGAYVAYVKIIVFRSINKTNHLNTISFSRNNHK